MQSYKKELPNFSDMFFKTHPELNKKDAYVKTLTFVVTQGCSLRCSYCYQQDKNNNHVMDLDTAKRAIDLIIKEYHSEDGYISHNNTTGIILEFIGGEPLIEIELINKIVDYYRCQTIRHNSPLAINYMIGITTNGVDYFHTKVQEFLKKNQGRVSLGITIDGNKELHDSCRRFPDGRGSYDVVEKAIKHYMKHHGGSRSTKLTLSPHNINYLSDAVTNLYDIGIEDVRANCVFEKGWTISHAKTFYKELKNLADIMLDKNYHNNYTVSLFSTLIGESMDEEDNKNWCGGTGLMMAVDADGLIYPCLRYLPFCLGNKREPIVIGNVDNGIGNSKKNKQQINELNAITRRTQSTDTCYHCPIASGCAWCSAYNYEETGSPNKRVTYICIMHKARVLANVYYWNKLYRKENMKERFSMNIPREWATDIIGETEYNKLLELSTDGGE